MYDSVLHRTRSRVAAMEAVKARRWEILLRKEACVRFRSSRLPLNDAGMDCRMEDKVNTHRLGIQLAAALVGMASGCAYLNGDAIWLSAEQRKVVLGRTFPTFEDVEYSFGDGNLPFCFEMTGYHEFGHIGHLCGVLDLSRGGLIKADSVLHISVSAQNAGEGVEFMISNGVMRVVKGCSMASRIERRTGPLLLDAVSMKGNEQWNETADGQLVSFGVWENGCSVRIHRPGEYGVVYNYEYPVHDTGPTRLRIYKMKNLRWFHWSSL